MRLVVRSAAVSIPRLYRRDCSVLRSVRPVIAAALSAFW